MFLHELKWQRNVAELDVRHRDEARRVSQPVLSAMTTKQDWCSVQLYSPSVVKVDGKYRMWYVGNATATRTDDMDLGYAESDDGIDWSEYADNPILRSSDLPFGTAWQTPRVLHESDTGLYKMWFISGESERDEQNNLLSYGQRLGYAESDDGISWDVHPEPIYPSGRGPCVHRLEGGEYQMWMNSAPGPDEPFGVLAANVFGFASVDGIEWKRDPEPSVIAGGPASSIVYPFVVNNDGDYTMWYGCHVEGGHFEIYTSTSTDGVTWEDHRAAPSFPATRNPDDFDGRYTSTPCVIDDGDRYLMYYSTRDLGNVYGAGDGTLKVDRMGIYRHIGVAVCAK